MNIKKIKQLFHISKTLLRGIIAWNIIALCYHCFFIDMTLSSSIYNQAFAIFIEWLVSIPYENRLVYYNEKINKTTTNKTLQNIKKYFIFTTLFAVTYEGTYFLRLEFLYMNDFITKKHISDGMFYMTFTTICMGAGIGWFLLAKRRKKEEKDKQSLGI